MNEQSSQPSNGDKAALRLWAKQRRALLADRAGGKSAQALATIFAAAALAQENQIVAGYWPHQSEISPVPLLEWCAAKGMECALPVAGMKERSLLFRCWSPGAALKRAGFDICEPLETAPQVTPDVVLVPLLAFDRAGHRLGYGHGFYDRALSALRLRGPVLAVGLGFAGQEVEGALPSERHDQPLDWIVTEREAHRVKS